MRPDLIPDDFAGRLSHVVEECGEVLKVIGKLQRFGPTPTNQKTGIKYDNVGDLRMELADLRCAMDRLWEYL